MPRNKAAVILEESRKLPYLDTSHVTRIGLIMSTIDQSKSVIVTKKWLGEVDGEFQFEKAFELGPILLHIDDLVILLVPNQDDQRVECYPISNNNEIDLWAPYDKAFHINKVTDRISVTMVNVNPLASYGELEGQSKAHLEALANLVVKFYEASPEIFQITEDLTKLNRKRKKNKREPFHPDFGVKK